MALEKLEFRMLERRFDDIPSNILVGCANGSLLRLSWPAVQIS